MGLIESEIKIAADPSLDPNVCKFTIDRPIYLEGAFNCRSKEKAKGSPLLDALFAIDGVAEVFIEGNTITVAKSAQDEWPVIGKKIGVAIRFQILAGGPLLAADLHAKPSPHAHLNSPEALAIQKVLDDEINPSVASHGGHVSLVEVKENIAYIRMEGGCKGCGQADVTLKQGIVIAIKKAVTTILEVLDVTDHAGGTNPYYQPSK